MQSATTSIRLPVDIRKQLERASRRAGSGRNSIVIAALKDYLQKLNSDDLAREARRQSLLATENSEASLWEANLDLEDWKI